MDVFVHDGFFYFRKTCRVTSENEQRLEDFKVFIADDSASSTALSDFISDDSVFIF